MLNGKIKSSIVDLLYLLPAVQPKQNMPQQKAMDYREQVYIAARDGNIMFLKVSSF